MWPDSTIQLHLALFHSVWQQCFGPNIFDFLKRVEIFHFLKWKLLFRFLGNFFTDFGWLFTQTVWLHWSFCTFVVYLPKSTKKCRKIKFSDNLKVNYRQMDAPKLLTKKCVFFKYKFWCFLTVSRVTFLLKNFQPLIFNLDQKSWPNSIQLTLTFSFRKTFLSSVLKKKYFSISIFTVYSIGFAPYLPKVQWPPLGYTSLYFNNTYIIILRYTSKCLRYTSKCLRYTSGLLWMYCAYTSYWMVLTKC